MDGWNLVALGIDWSSPTVLASLATLTFLEIVLGVDNIIFLAVLASRLPRGQQALARSLGLAFALVTRLALLASISWIASLTRPLFTVMGYEISWRDLILILGGLFLLAKATTEIHHQVEGGASKHREAIGTGAFWLVVFQIGLLDIVFSLDSVITAVGLVPFDQFPIMAIAIVIAILVMLFASGPIGNFVNDHPTVKMLALAFLVLIGVALMADGLDFHIPKGYIYFAIAFSVSVEALNLMARGKSRTAVEPSKDAG